VDSNQAKISVMARRKVVFMGMLSGELGFG